MGNRINAYVDNLYTEVIKIDESNLSPKEKVAKVCIFEPLFCEKRILYYTQHTRTKIESIENLIDIWLSDISFENSASYILLSERVLIK
jgi:hypothetical protein